MELIKLEAIRDYVITLTSHVYITDAFSKQDSACTSILVSCNTMHLNCS
jgi:hypothetical protein